MSHNPFGHDQWSQHEAISQSDPWSVASGWVDDTRPSAQRQAALERIRRYKPNALKKFLAWGLVTVTVLFMLLMLIPIDEDWALWDTVAWVSIALMFGLPGFYWVFRDRQDRQTMSDWTERRQQQQSLRQFLQGPDLALMGEPEPEPLLPKRQWAKVSAAQLAFFVLFVTAANLGA